MPAAIRSARQRGRAALSLTVAATLLPWTLPAAAQPADATPALGEVRINASAEKDVGFATTEAQTAGKAPMRRLETPQSISVVTREQMESRQITNLQQALQTVAGVSPVNFGRRGIDDVNIRGFRSSESILIDGLVQSPGMWTRLVPYGFERFEVLKGASSVLYGQVQPGGIVNAVSKRPKKDALGEIGFEAGSYGLRTATADINRPLSENGKTALRINTLASNTDDPTDSVWRRDRWIAPSLSLDLGRDTDFVLFATYYRAQWMRQQGTTPYGTLLPNRNGRVPLSLFTGDPSLGSYDIEQVTLGYALEHRLNPNVTLRQNVRYEEEKGTGAFVSLLGISANQRLVNRQGQRQRLDYDILATDTSVLASFDALGLAHRLVAGVDARVGHSRAATTRCTMPALDLFAPVYGVAASCGATPQTDAPEKLGVAGLYAQDQIKFGPGWTALIGLRHDTVRQHTDNRVTGQNTRRNQSATTFSGGLVYEFTPGWSVYGSYGESFLPVSGSDAAGRPFVPETGTQWETGVKVEGRGVTGAVAVYDLRRRNVTATDPANTGFSIQVGEQRSRGLEVEAGVDIARGLKLTGSYAYTDAQVTRDTTLQVGSPINLTPRHVGTVWATWRVPQWPGVTLGAGLRSVSRQVGSYPFSLPAYTVADLSVGYTTAQWRITAGLKNVFDRTYYDGAVNANVVSPGMPRNGSVSFTYFF